MWKRWKFLEEIILRNRDNQSSNRSLSRNWSHPGRWHGLERRSRLHESAESSRERVGRLCRHADEALNNWKNSNLKVAKVPWKLQDNDPKAHEDTRKTQVPPSDPRISLVPNLGLCCKLWAWESQDSRSPQLVGERYLMGFTKGRRNSGQKKNILIPAQSNSSITICAAPYVLSTMKILITEKIIFF